MRPGPGPAEGSILQHLSGAVIVAASHSDGSPPNPIHPCWVVIRGHCSLGNRPWLSGFEVDTIGGWTEMANLHEMIAWYHYPPFVGDVVARRWSGNAESNANSTPCPTPRRQRARRR